MGRLTKDLKKRTTQLVSTLMAPLSRTHGKETTLGTGRLPCHSRCAPLTDARGSPHLISSHWPLCKGPHVLGFCSSLSYGEGRSWTLIYCSIKLQQHVNTAFTYQRRIDTLLTGHIHSDCNRAIAPCLKPASARYGVENGLARKTCVASLLAYLIKPKGPPSTSSKPSLEYDGLDAHFRIIWTTRERATIESQE